MMDETKLRLDFDAFLEDHPEIDPAWRETVAPVIKGADDDFYAFIIGHLLI